MAKKERDWSKDHGEYRSCLTEAYSRILEDIGPADDPGAVVIHTINGLEEAGLCIEGNTPDDVTVRTLMQLREKGFTHEELLALDRKSLSQTTVVAMAKAGLLDTEACNTLVE
ncbi:hypothetical protein A3E49_01000 [Candidatus Saccharibacteria bacterium RIFCSPHIGHO2_12_FULL_49_19]|nr:MAG: hypothetical protein A2708_01125 [Candidatus Saccharibacteria bacterium RIFCSPHIGHO2_01_FULL_49_21]OGL36860.1 MAG: hypothetical protein A3E49_01000 [Candidatus Saccharibacteria bacterium RIFCSPHIGHO2_12_FULL_49_19]OGL37091.1 MAG: hypothetical protein A3B63_01610 [Candidatus Saccharibacteria bacterium RIFCSPLOWO2_01_FULL_49_22]